VTRKHLSLLSILPLVALLAACGREEERGLTIRTAPVERRTIIVSAEATGVIEPINVVEVKSRASGQVIEMPVETGSLVRPGALIDQLDTRDVQNQYDQAKADLDAAEKKLQVSEIQKKRSDELFAAKIITAQENEAAQLDWANSQSSIVRSRASLDLAQQRLDDARVTAPVTGTIIGKPVSLGQVIQSGTSTAGGGTTIVTMADLTKVRARALVNETDIGRVRAGLIATVTVDAFPDRPFAGVVEKIEPQAVVQQNVTMFPVLVSLENRDGLLMPGMNGEVSIQADRREDVLAVPNDAVRTVREAAQAATALGLDPDSVQAQIRASMGGGMGGGFGGGIGGQRPQQVPVRNSPGFVDFAQGGTQGGRQGNFQLPDVTAAQCTEVETKRKAKPEIAKRIDDLQAKMREATDRQAMMADIRAAYTELGVDQNIVRACRMRETQGTATPPAGNTGPAGARPAGAPSAATSATTSATTPASTANRQTNGSRNAARGAATRTGLVFVQRADSGWIPRVVRLGISDYDFTEVISGLEEGDQVALLTAAILQVQRQESQERMRQMQGGASPLGGGAGGAMPGGGGGGGGGGGARPPGR
jgi:HlyD family secretion protein